MCSRIMIRKALVSTLCHGAAAVCLGAGLAGVALAGRPSSQQQPPPRPVPYKCIDAGKVVYSDAPCVSSTGPGTGSDRGTKLSEQQVLQLVHAFDESAGRLDWEGLTRNVADDAVIQIQRSASRGGRISMGKAEYRRLRTERGGKMRNYTLRREGVQIQLNLDANRAEVASKLTQSWLDPGGPLLLSSEETWIVEPRGGRPRIVIMDILERDPRPQLPH